MESLSKLTYQAPDRSFSPSTTFGITIRLPRSNSPSLSISSFEAYLPLFRITLPPLDPAVHFGSLSLRSTNSEINIGVRQFQ
jgi:hypothetical protein